MQMGVKVRRDLGGRPKGSKALPQQMKRGPRTASKDPRERCDFNGQWPALEPLRLQPLDVYQRHEDRF